MTKSLVCCFDVFSTFATFTVRVLHAVSILFIRGTRARVRLSPNVDIVDYFRVCWTFCHAFPSTAASTVLFVYCLSFFTSSTAQGGGGSFKNRKRIGDIDCCE